ncbi:MAG TPA: type II toxin-antitoxin system RelE/ParE family toxin [Allosphingosinicella sp.]|nr:type II toxin-antitoxin system RelE/ParE family toxin [Allosphingosinicella sp.]
MVEVQTTKTFLRWQRKLADERAAAKIAVAIERLRFGLGDVASVGGGVSEVRIDYGPGYRLYFTRRGGELIILLCGGDKSSQGRDIKKAKEVAAAL